jgi:pseudouridine-5'-phosphate glycosidase
VEKTLEVLETQGVPVIAVGQQSFPAFWSATSPLKAPLRMDTPAEIARAHRMRRQLRLPGGQLVANPIPLAEEIPAATLAPIIAQAQADAESHGIRGKAVTPYLLQRIFELTEGRSLKANIALVRNNARLAGEIAKALSSETRQTCK